MTKPMSHGRWAKMHVPTTTARVGTANCSSPPQTPATASSTPANGMVQSRAQTGSVRPHSTITRP